MSARKIYLSQLFLVFVFLSHEALAASFIFTPFEKQLRDADATVLGVVKGSTVKKTPENQIMTRYTLELSWSSGLDRNQNVHPKSFYISVPGGSWQGIEYNISGTPKFSAGEKVFLLLKDSKFGHTILNLSLGKYTPFNKGTQTYLKSSVFTEHPELNSLSLDSVKKMAKEKFKVVTDYKSKDLLKKTNRKFISSLKTQENQSLRSPASAQKSNNKKHSHTGLFWPFFILVTILASRKILRFRVK